MLTYSFIGSDKNAGKTTAFNYVYSKIHREAKATIGITGIGVNGEEIDQFDGRAKPPITILKGSYFVTRGKGLARHTGKYETLGSLRAPNFSHYYVIGRCLIPFNLLLEGPNTGSEVRAMKKTLHTMLPKASILLLDGSLDRQFLAHPEISNAFYFSLLFSSRPAQRRKVTDLLSALSLSLVQPEIRQRIQVLANRKTRSLLLNESGDIQYHGTTIPYNDNELLTACKQLRKSTSVLYLNGALSRSLYKQLASFSHLEIVLDNFTLYQTITIEDALTYTFSPLLSLLHPLKIKEIFIKQEAEFDSALLPKEIPARNLYRDNEVDYAT